MLRKIRNLLKKIFNSEVLAIECRHKTKIKGVVDVFLGKSMVPSKSNISLNLDDNGNTSHCIDCIEESAIRCAWCGGTILPGAPITLYCSTDDKFHPPEYAVIYNPENHDKPSYIGCLRWDCAETGGDMCGHWEIDKQVHRELSPIEKCILTGKPVVVNDFG